MRFILPCLPASAQGPEIAGLLPAGGQRGTTAVVQVDGKNLQGAKVLLSGRGVRVESAAATAAGDGATIKLAIAPDAPLGPHEVRIGTPKGVSNPARLWVDVLPSQLEVEPNDDPAHAQRLDRTPIVVDGRIQAAGDRDTFSFQAGAGETWVFDVCAARIRSRLDPIIELRDEAGSLVKMAQSTWESDPRLVYTFAKDGRYFVTVRDTQFLGGPDFAYRLSVGKLPTVSGFLPRGEKAGRPVEMLLQGVNLGGTAKATINIPPDAAPGEFWTTVQTANGLALPFPLLIDANPVVGITETDANMPLPLLPASLDGVFEVYTRIRFFFKGTPADHFVFDLLGRRIGSRIDGALRILNAAGKEVAANDDAVGKDARLEFTPPAEGIYTVEARNVEEKTGPDCYYRLSVQHAAPDFRLLLNLDRLHVGAGGTVVFPVVLERLHGFDGPVKLGAEELPSGVVFSGGTITPGQAGIEVTLTAPAAAPLGASAIRLYGSAVIDGKTVVREAVSREEYLPRAIDPGMFTDDSYRRPYRVCDLLPLGIIERAEPFGLTVAPTAITLAPGGKAEIVVRAVRRPGADGEIKLELRGLPGKVTAPAPAIAAGQTEARVTLTAAPDAPAAVRNVILQGRLDKAVQPAQAVAVAVKR